MSTSASSSVRRPRVVIVGAGAAGTLVALHLTRTAALRSTGVDLVLLDPADRWGRGVAFGTSGRAASHRAVNDGQAEIAQQLLETRLERRPSPLDRRRLRSISITEPEPSVLVP